MDSIAMAQSYVDAWNARDPVCCGGCGKLWDARRADACRCGAASVERPPCW